jgi:hypothetical protein
MLPQCTFIHGFGLSSVIAFVEYRTSVASNFNDGGLFFGERSYIIASG